MKQFEKWFNKHLEEHAQYCIDNYGTIDRELPKKMLMPYKHFHQDAWREALKWVLGEHGPLDERVNNPACARGRIRKELEE